MLIAIIAMQALTAPAALEPDPARLLVTSANSAATVKDYPSLKACEAVRDRLIQYNRGRIKAQTIKGGEDVERNLPVWATCLPL